MALRPPATLSRPQVPRLLACAVVFACVALIPDANARAQGGASGARPSASATVEQCVTAVNQPERAATFAGEMTAIAGSARMEMKIDVLERMPEELHFHAVSAPGLGVWRSSSQGVKVYKYLKQVTNLSAPAFYRAAVRFRWLNARGRLIKAVEMRTARCEQPASPPAPGPPATTGTP
jgi:hypothetical protein